MSSGDLEWARWVAGDPNQHSSADILQACWVLAEHGEPADAARAFRLRMAVEVTEGSGAAWGWAFVTTFFILGCLVAWLGWHLLSAVEWQAVLRFIAPTAFEIRPIEALLEGARE